MQKKISNKPNIYINEYTISYDISGAFNRLGYRKVQDINILGSYDFDDNGVLE